MAVRIGRIELRGLTSLYTEDTRNLVQQRVPGQAGSVFQDLGREPVTIVMEGILLGEDTLGALEQLRQAQLKATPLSFSADALAGTEVLDVLIADFQVRQLSGHDNRYSFLLKVKEYVEPPASERAGVAAVNQAVASDAAAWAEGSVAAASVLQDPDSLMAAVASRPELLGHLSPDELGAVVLKTQGTLTGQNFGTLVGALGQVNPEAVGGFVDALKKGGGLGTFLQKLATEGVNLAQLLKGIDFGAAMGLVKALAGAGDFLARLRDVVDTGRALGTSLGDFDPLGPLRDLEKELKS